MATTESGLAESASPVCLVALNAFVLQFATQLAQPAESLYPIGSRGGVCLLPLVESISRYSERSRLVINVEDITRLHRDMVVRWHGQDVDNPFSDELMSTVCQQFQFNFRLWHEEDIARSRDVGDDKIAEVKRNIDGHNQNRNDWIEKIDDLITDWIERDGIQVQDGARQNTETIGSVVDRLSILALRIYHMDEQLERDDATVEHKQKVERKLAVCLVQMADLSESLQDLIDDVAVGRVRHKTYRQFKMYNDPTLNPYLYQARRAG